MASPYETLEIERSGRVATLWMNRPDVFNAFNEQLIAELHQACTEGAGEALLRRCRPQLDEARLGLR
jgi:methylglutaconyl-CoA hydratase